MKFLLKVLIAIGTLLAVIIAGMIALYSPALPTAYRSFLCYLLISLFFLTFFRFRFRNILKILICVQILWIYFKWNELTPQSEREWAEEYSRMPTVKIDGDDVEIKNIRSYQYEKGIQKPVQYYDKRLKLSDLRGLDIFVSYWAGKAIAHVMVSFNFGDKDYIPVSIETRREKSESYSAINGFFRNYELTYVVADERDLIRLRTVYRDPSETVYLLRTNMALGTVRKFFLDYVQSINDLASNPEFYNTLSSNCTTQVLFHTRVNQDHLPYTWKIFLSGYVPDYLYEINALQEGLSLEEILEKGRVNERSIAAGNSDNFSNLIREGVPRPKPVSDD